jgi:hypothetical protein
MLTMSYSQLTGDEMTTDCITTESTTGKRLFRAGWLLSLEDIYEKLRALSVAIEASNAPVMAEFAVVVTTVEELLSWDYTDFECEKT